MSRPWTWPRYSHGNLLTMKQLSGGVRKQPEVVEAAKREDFVKYVQKHHPDQHISKHESLKLRPTEEQKAEILEAMDLAMERGDARTREEEEAMCCMWAVEYRWHSAEVVEDEERSLCHQLVSLKP